MRSNVAKPRGAKQGVTHRMRQNIAVGVSNRSFVEGKLDSADN
jgi:hypothetical protein